MPKSFALNLLRVTLASGLTSALIIITAWRDGTEREGPSYFANPSSRHQSETQPSSFQPFFFNLDFSPSFTALAQDTTAMTVGATAMTMNRNDIAPLSAHYIPSGFGDPRSMLASTSGKELYERGADFILITQTPDQTTSLPTGQAAAVGAQPATLASGLSGTVDFPRFQSISSAAVPATGSATIAQEFTLEPLQVMPNVNVVTLPADAIQTFGVSSTGAVQAPGASASPSFSITGSGGSIQTLPGSASVQAVPSFSLVPVEGAVPSTSTLQMAPGFSGQAVGSPLTYDDARRLTWMDGEIRVEILSNLPTDEIMRIAESMSR